MGVSQSYYLFSSRIEFRTLIFKGGGISEAVGSRGLRLGARRGILDTRIVRVLTLHVSGRNSAVECQLPKLDVAGSIPVARSKTFLNHQLFHARHSKVELDG